MNIIGWRVYYADGSEYDSRETTWVDLPDDGVLAVNVFHDEPATQTIYGYDWYFHVPGTDLFGGDNHDDIPERYPGAVLKRGKWVPYTEWVEFQSRVKADAWERGDNE